MEHVTDPQRLAAYSRDWTGRWHSNPVVAYLPTDSAEVAEALAVASTAGLPVVIHGGNTGLVGGAVGGAEPHAVLVTSRLRGVLEVDADKGELLVSAGFTLGEVQRAAEAAGWSYPVDLAARDSATIGGTIATNAGGIRVLAFGMTEGQVLGLEVVTADGEVRDWLTHLPKDNAGSDLWPLMIGSEGTLGVVTAARLKLMRPRRALWTALIPCESVAAAIALAKPMQRDLLAAELMCGEHIDEVAEVAGLPKLPSAPWWLLLESDVDDALSRLPEDSLIAQDTGEISRFWQYRELHTEAIARRGEVLKLDTAVPVARLQDFASGVISIGRSHGVDAADIFRFGHVLDGNLHLSFVGRSADKGLEAAVLGLAVELGGAISAEHGIGQAKGDYLSLMRPTAERALRQRLRLAFDPARSLNAQIRL